MEISQSDMNSVLAFASRAVPTLRGEATVAPGGIRVASSLRVPGIPGGRWLNLRVAVAPSTRGLQLASVKLGTFDLPAGMVLPAARVLMDLVFGDRAGTIAVNSIDGIAINGRKAIVGVALTRADRKALTGRLKATARTIANISSPNEVRAYYLAIDKATADGRLKTKGSTVPYLRLAMELANQKAQGGDAQAEVQSALLALTIYCGHIKFERLIGDVVPENMRGKRNGCAGTTLGGRADLRQHFVISAGLQAASNEGAAFTIGEFKELLDSARKKGSGFSFDDLAADRAGIRFATALLESGAPDRQSLISRLQSERNVFPSISGLPGRSVGKRIQATLRQCRQRRLSRHANDHRTAHRRPALLRGHLDLALGYCLSEAPVRAMVRSRRLELPRVLPHSDLNAARLPIPPRPQVSSEPDVSNHERENKGSCGSKPKSSCRRPKLPSE